MRKLFIKTEQEVINQVTICEHRLNEGNSLPRVIKQGKMVGAYYTVHSLLHGGLITTITTVVPNDSKLRLRVVVDSFKASEVGEIESLINRLEGLKVSTHTAMMQREVTTWHFVE